MSSGPIISKHFKLKSDIVPSKENKVSKYEEGKPYVLENDEYFKAFYKRVNEEKYNGCDVVLLGGYVVIGQDQRAEYKLPYEETYLIADKSDPRKLLLQSNNLAISLQFENLKLNLLMKEAFVENKNLLLKCHLANFIKEIESFETQIKEDK